MKRLLHFVIALTCQSLSAEIASSTTSRFDEPPVLSFQHGFVDLTTGCSVITLMGVGVHGCDIPGSTELKMEKVVDPSGQVLQSISAFFDKKYQVLANGQRRIVGRFPFYHVTELESVDEANEFKPHLFGDAFDYRTIVLNRPYLKRVYAYFVGANNYNFDVFNNDVAASVGFGRLLFFDRNNRSNAISYLPIRRNGKTFDGIEIIDSFGNHIQYILQPKTHQIVVETRGQSYTLKFHPTQHRIQSIELGTALLSFSYDPRGRLSLLSDHTSGAGMKFKYKDGLSNIVSALTHTRVDGAPIAPSTTITYGQVGANPSVEVTDHMGTTQWVFDTSNRVLSYRVPGTIEDYSYENASHPYLITKLKTSITPPGATAQKVFTEQYTYNGLGLVTETRDGGQITRTYQFDSMGLLISSKDPNGATYQATRDDNGLLLTETYGNKALRSGDTYRYGYDSASFLNSIAKNGISIFTSTNDTTRGGLPTSVTDSGITTQYGYSDLEGYKSQSVRTDFANGNILSTSIDPNGETFESTIRFFNGDTDRVVSQTNNLSDSGWSTRDSHGPLSRKDISSPSGRPTVTTYTHTPGDGTTLVCTETQASMMSAATAAASSQCTLNGRELSAGTATQTGGNR